MTKKFDFDAVPSYPARRSDPETSHEAAADKQKNLADSQREVRRVVREAGPYGRTAAELASQLDKPSDWVRPRLAELERGGHVFSRGTRMNHASGKQQKVWFDVRYVPTRRG